MSGTRRQLPAETGLWVFIFGELTVFAILFAAHLHGLASDPALFRDSQARLSIALGTINTIILLTSSLLVVLAVRSARDGAAVRARRLLSGAIVLGVAFAVIKVAEYIDKASAGIAFEENDFFISYYTLTALHLMHVTIGLCVLAALRFRLGTGRSGPNDRTYLEAGGSFWHMVDLLWLVLFPLLYLVR